MNEQEKLIRSLIRSDFEGAKQAISKGADVNYYITKSAAIMTKLPQMQFVCRKLINIDHQFYNDLNPNNSMAFLASNQEKFSVQYNGILIVMMNLLKDGNDKEISANLEILNLLIKKGAHVNWPCFKIKQIQGDVLLFEGELSEKDFLGNLAFEIFPLRLACEFFSMTDERYKQKWDTIFESLMRKGGASVRLGYTGEHHIHFNQDLVKTTDDLQYAPSKPPQYTVLDNFTTFNNINNGVNNFDKVACQLISFVNHKEIQSLETILKKSTRTNLYYPLIINKETLGKLLNKYVTRLNRLQTMPLLVLFSLNSNGDKRKEASKKLTDTSSLKEIFESSTFDTNIFEKVALKFW